MLNCIIVGIGGFLGSVCRYLISLIPVKDPARFPVKTFAINLIGSFLIGVIAGAVLKNTAIGPKAVLFLKVGICGGFTTFSSFVLEGGDLLRGGNMGVALLYMVLSVVFGILAVFCGQAVVR